MQPPIDTPPPVPPSPVPPPNLPPANVPPSNVPPPYAPPPKKSGAGWLIVAGVTVLVIVLGLWAMLSGMPFGGKSQPSRPSSGQPLDTIGEGAQTGSVSQIGEPPQITPVPAAPPPTSTSYDATGTFATTTTSLPPGVSTAPPGTPPPATATSAAPAPVVVAPPVARVPTTPPVAAPRPAPQRLPPQPMPQRVPAPQPLPAPAPRPAPQRLPPTPLPQPQPAPAPQPAPQTSGGMLDEQGAIIRLRSFIAQHNPYDVPVRCLDISSLGFSNRGYTLQVSQQSCGGSEARTLDRWRVDTLTREVFRQHSNGKFLRP